MHEGHRFIAVNIMETDLRQANDDIHDPDHAKRLMRQLLLACAHLEEHGIVHADIKPENILLDASKEVLNLADFGCASEIDSGDICTYGNTLSYRSPEILVKAKNAVRPPADVWSCACVCFELIAKTILFDPDDSNLYSQQTTESNQSSYAKNKEQLCLFQELLGRFPRRFARAYREYFNAKGNILEVGEITTVDLRAVMVKECDVEPTLAFALYDFLMPMLRYTTRVRAKAKDALSHAFLQNLQERLAD